jgi:PPOX class probable FMN-dependent enzyme
MTIDSLDQLRTLYPAAKERSVKKQLPALDVHCRRFIELSPFVVLASGGSAGAMDASPRGGPPGFVKVRDDKTLLIPDAPGNNRLDTLENIIGTGKLGLFFMVPGVDETLRVNGSARLSTDAGLLGLFSEEKRQPKLVIAVTVAEAYLHCAKALMRSKLWDPTSLVERTVLPTMGEMLKSQIGLDGPAESQETMRARYAADL